jgi:UDP-2,3-diacylglucosamine hydrolase
LCTADTAYQAFREQVRAPQWQATFLARPLAVRKAITRGLRERSRAATNEKADYIMDVAPDAVTSLMRTHGAYRLIHGHTHRPAVHRFELDGHAAERMVLGDWGEAGSVLVCTAAGCELRQVSSGDDWRPAKP